MKQDQYIGRCSHLFSLLKIQLIKIPPIIHTPSTLPIIIIIVGSIYLTHDYCGIYAC